MFVDFTLIGGMRILLVSIVLLLRQRIMHRSERHVELIIVDWAFLIPTSDYFWRHWNIPVHAWMVRHVYLPLVNNGFSKFFASVSIFFISGVFHEMIVSIPFGTVKLWAFFGLMGQVPLAILTRKFLRNKHIGNVVFWASILLGQPFIILMYYRDWHIRNN
jgi:diacylglycerol O-acyltransferase 1